MAIEINTTNNKAENVNFNDDTANLNITDTSVQGALEELDARIDVNELEISELKGGQSNIPTVLNNLTDVNITTPSTDQVLKYDGTEWINDTIAGGSGGGGASSLDQLTDVTITTPSNFDIVSYDTTTSKFINRGANEAGLATSTHTHPASDISSGQFSDVRISQSSVTQHQSALSITESQISDLGNYLTNVSTQTLTNLSNVNVPSPTNGQVLTFNTSNSLWEATSITPGGTAPTFLTDLTDIDIDSVGNGEFLTWDSTNSQWINRTVNEAGVASATHTHDAANITTGTINNAHISESSITQHEGALTITESQISDLGNYLTTIDISNEQLSDLSNVSSTAPSDGQVLTYNNSSSTWEPSSLSSGGANSLDDLSDVTITTSFIGHVIKYDGTKYISAYLDAGEIASGTIPNLRISEANVTQHESALTITESQISDLGTYLTDLTGESLSDLSDVNATNPSDGQVLSFNNSSGNWEASSPTSGGANSLNDLSDVVLNPTANNQVIKHNGTNFVNSFLSASDITSGTFNDNRISENNVRQYESNFQIGASQVVSGTFPNARITSSAVTQHQGDLTITESQVSDLGSYLVDISGRPLNELSDVDTTAPTDGQILIYSSANSRWEPGAAPSGGGGGSTFSGCKVRTTGNTTYNSSTSSALEANNLEWDEEVFDTDNYWTSANDSIITIPSTGLYRFSGSISSDSNESTGNHSLTLRLDVNGAVNSYIGQSGLSKRGTLHCSFNWLGELTAGDEVSLRATMYFSGNHSLIIIGSSTQDWTFLTVEKVKEGTV